MSELIGPNPCHSCGGEYGEHTEHCPHRRQQCSTESNGFKCKGEAVHRIGICIYCDHCYLASIIKMWPQAAGELVGLANAMDGKQMGITASQIRMAIKLANAHYAAIEKMIPVKD